MSKKHSKKEEMLDHYDFSGGVRGKYINRDAEGRTACVSGRSSAENAASSTRTDAAVTKGSDSSDVTLSEA